MSRVVITGAGPAGLMAAWRAAEDGHDVTVLEAADHVGGMAGSFTVADQRVDFGSHRLHPATDPALMARIRELLGDDLQTRPRNGRIRLHDRWVGFPLTPVGMATGLPPSFTAKVARDTAMKVVRRGGDDGSFDGALRRRLGSTVASDFYAPYARKLYGEDPTVLTSELADRRVAATSPLTIIKKALRASRPDGRVLVYPRRGYGQIAEAIADAAVGAGVDLRLSTPVERISVVDDAVSVSADGASFDADLALSSMPIDVLARGLDPAPPAAVTDALGRIRHRAMVLSYLVLPRVQYTPFDAHYLPDDQIHVSRLSEPKNYRDGDDPVDQTVLCAELPCWVGDDIWQADADALAELVSSELLRSGLPATNHVAAEVRRLPRVYPVYDLAGETDRETVDAWEIDERVVAFGRQGLRVPDNLHHVLAMGVAAADAVAGGSLDRSAWRSSLADFATHVVQD
ncbi:MAG: FAD-dependent oxidoreductase [Actinomycetota bacterium]